MQTLHMTAAPLSPTATAGNPELALMLLGPSTAMAHLWSQMRRLAPHVRTVLFTGPPDAGHEAAARLLLDLSLHPKRPFLVLRGAEAEDRLADVASLHALPQDLLLFLPEIEHLSAGAQHCLLRLLRTRRNHAFSVVASSGEDLRALVSLGRFSAELADILGAVRVFVPALKDRVEDIPMLLGQMLAARCRRSGKAVPPLSEELLRTAMQYPWPANFRELTAVADFLVELHSDGRELCAADLFRAWETLQTPKPVPGASVRMVKLDTVVQEHIYAVLGGCRGNKLRAAEILGISRSTLYRMLDATTGSAPLPWQIGAAGRSQAGSPSQVAGG